MCPRKLKWKWPSGGRGTRISSVKTSTTTHVISCLTLGSVLQGMTVFALVHGLWFATRKAKLPPRAYTAANAMLAMTYVQVRRSGHGCGRYQTCVLYCVAYMVEETRGAMMSFVP